MQHPGGPAGSCPPAHGVAAPQHQAAPAASPAVGSWLQLTPAALPQLLGSHLLPAPAATGLSIQQAASTDTPARQPATLGSPHPSPSSAAPKCQLLDLQPLQLHGARKTHQPEPKRRSSRCSVPSLASGTGGPLSPPCHNRLHGRRVGTARFPVPPKAKGQGKEVKNNTVLKIQHQHPEISATRTAGRTTCAFLSNAARRPGPYLFLDRESAA